GIQRRCEGRGLATGHLYVVRASSPAVVGAGGGGDAEGDRTVLDSEIVENTAREARQHHVAVLRFALLTTRLFGVDTGPQLERESGVAGDVGEVETDAVPGVGVFDRVDPRHD